MANTFRLIASALVTVTDGTGSLTFTNIPSTYTHLYVLVSARDNDGGTLSGYDMQLNGANISGNQTIQFYQSTSGKYNTAGDLLAAGHGSASDLFGNSALYIPNYTTTNVVKSGYSFGAVVNTGSNQGYVALWAGPNATSGVVTSITFGPSFTRQQSTAYLYGLASS